jgi:hypothetical protein
MFVVAQLRASESAASWAAISLMVGAMSLVAAQSAPWVVAFLVMAIFWRLRPAS